MTNQSSMILGGAILTPTQCDNGFEEINDADLFTGYSSGIMTPNASEDSRISDWLGFDALSLDGASENNASAIDAPPSSESQTYYGSLLAEIKREDKAMVGEVALGNWQAQTHRQRRISRELRMIHEDENLPYVSISPIGGSLNKCLACLEGSPDSPYAGGVFWLYMTFPERYPTTPVSIRFITPVYHPNIDPETGVICCDIFEESWSPILNAYNVLISVLSLLHSPDADDPLCPDVARCFKQDYLGYCKSAHIYTEQYAQDPRPATSHLFPPPRVPNPGSGSDRALLDE